LQASALLDQQENERRKRLLNAAAGIRAFAGAAITRATPGNTAAPGGPSASQMSTAGSFVAPTAGSSSRGGAPGSSVKPF